MSKGRVGGIAAAVIIVIALIVVFSCMERVPTGYLGVVYSMNGGVQEDALEQGFHFVSPAKEVSKFSIGNEQLILSKDAKEGSKDDESFLVSTSDNANIKISFQMSYRYKADKVVDTYKRFRGMDGEDIVNQRVRTVLKAKISEVTSKYTMMDIYSGNRGEINKEITLFLGKELGDEFGIEIIDASIIDVHPDSQLEKTIQDRVTAMQKKQQAEAEQQTVMVEAQTNLIKAENEAKIKLTQAQAEADANKVISNSITQQLIDMKLAEARVKNGWVEVNGGTPIVNAQN